MEDAKLYSIEEIEKLKQKIASYRDTLTRLKIESSVDEDLFMKGEFTNSKASNEVTGETGDKQNMQMEEAEQQIEEISLQINGLNQTVKGLNEELTSILTKVKDSEHSGMSEKIETPTDVQSSLSVTNKQVEQKSATIEEVNPLRKGILATVIREAKNPPSYKQLQSLVGRSNSDWRIPTNTMPKDSMELRQELEGMNMNGRSFPSIPNHSSQLNNDRYRNNVMKSTVFPNKAVRVPVISVTANEVMGVLPSVNEPKKEVKHVRQTDPRVENELQKEVVVEAAPEPLKAAMVEIDLESEKTVSLEVEVEPEKAESVGIDLEPEKAVSLEVEVGPEKAESVEVDSEPEKAVSLEIEVGPEKVESIEIDMEPEKTVSLEVEVESERAESVEINLEPEEVVSLEVEPESEKVLSVEVNPEPQNRVSVEVTMGARDEEAPKIEPIELPSRMKQRERKNKEKLSFFHFFRRRK